MTRIARIEVRRLRLPLVKPYRLSYRTFDEFEPYVVLIEDADGGFGVGDAHVSPGSSSETREGAWAFIARHAQSMIGMAPQDGKDAVLAHFAESKAATTALVSALEVLQRPPVLTVDEEIDQPLLEPISALDEAGIVREADELIADGYRTFKVKVGKDVTADLARVAVIQRAIAGRATMRLDANRGFSREDGIAFASALDPQSIDLFEQPCHSDDWEANGAVARVSPVPLMLDEPICTLEDIARAGTMEGVGFCKLKLKRFGGLARLQEGFDAVRAHGMEPVLGDGLGSEIQGWLEACAARRTIRNAGEFNGFTKAHERLFTNPIPVEKGVVRLPPGYWPSLDMHKLERLTVDRMTFGAETSAQPSSIGKRSA